MVGIIQFSRKARGAKNSMTGAKRISAIPLLKTARCERQTPVAKKSKPVVLLLDCYHNEQKLAGTR
jgi:hypothetical protein